MSSPRLLPHPDASQREPERVVVARLRHPGSGNGGGDQGADATTTSCWKAKIAILGDYDHVIVSIIL